ncbi:hypothetical protein UCRNP2_1391 [Neofusicoccum parvum UCRNP2]|uniref:Uncharacterized protein n=1 Tax=Botryosphaeria parva (strain UCR-NP2) TaxID=1287680 RepID=R1EW25_BOTPV|nr:hypothetical protein UCRNP2_1391 [Neofusicoccum parvum UCRNP2]
MVKRSRAESAHLKCPTETTTSFYIESNHKRAMPKGLGSFPEVTVELTTESPDMVASGLPGGSTVPVLGAAEDSIDKLLNPDNYVVTGHLETFIQTPTNTRYWTATSWF